MKHIGFRSFGHWTPSPQSKVRTASDSLLQSIEPAVAAEKLGADGAFFRVHHYARQLDSPFPLLAAVGNVLDRIVADAGYHGRNAPPDYKFKVYTAGQKRRLTEQVKRDFKQRAAIEPVISKLTIAWTATTSPIRAATPSTQSSSPRPTTSAASSNG